MGDIGGRDGLGRGAPCVLFGPPNSSRERCASTPSVILPSSGRPRRLFRSRRSASGGRRMSTERVIETQQRQSGLLPHRTPKALHPHVGSSRRCPRSPMASTISSVRPRRACLDDSFVAEFRLLARQRFDVAGRAEFGPGGAPLMGDGLNSLAHSRARISPRARYASSLWASRTSESAHGARRSGQSGRCVQGAPARSDMDGAQYSTAGVRISILAAHAWPRPRRRSRAHVDGKRYLAGLGTACCRQRRLCPMR